MKVLFISPSAGDAYYCGNCFRDNLQAQALQQAGHEVVVMPLYLPMKISTEGVPVFFPATSYYVEQALFRSGKMPRWMRKAIGAPKLLDMASGLSGTTSSEGMEGMTLSMIEGADGAFRKNMDDMIAWMRADGMPDVVHLSSTLLIGIARILKEETGVPIVCSLQDEEVWLDGLKQPYVPKAWNAISENARFVDAFVTTSEFYRDIVRKRLPDLPDPAVVYPGVDLDKYRTETLPERPTIGFFYRMNRLDGLDLLAQAFVELKRRGTVPGLQLRIGGGFMGSDDKRFLAEVKAILEPCKADVIYDEYDSQRHADFYKKITVLSVPLRFEEGVGLYLCEAFAAGRPAVEPRTGSFPEILGEAGILYDPETNPAAPLADALERLLTDADLYQQSVDQAKQLAQERYNATVMANELTNIYESIK